MKGWLVELEWDYYNDWAGCGHTTIFWVEQGGVRPKSLQTLINMMNKGKDPWVAICPDEGTIFSRGFNKRRRIKLFSISSTKVDLNEII